MVTSHLTIDVFRYSFCSTLAVIIVTGCAQGASPDEYRESEGQVAKCLIEQTDISILIATYVRLRDGAIQDPRVFHYQMHYTAIGVQKVEKPGRLSQMTSKVKPFLFLPVSESIDEYLFLVRKPIVSKKEVDGVAKRSTEWTDWALFVVPAKEVKPEKPIVIPPFDKLAKSAGDQNELLKKVQAMHKKAEIAAEKRMNTPIKSDSDVPWYAR